jgi:tRNA dimethylallyltransferase
MSPLIILAGPTATGKSEIACLLAEELGTEVINADSMQVYRHFDIGTAKPSPELCRRAPHHLIDILEPHEEFNAYDFKIRALEHIRRLTGEHKIPIVAGGTGLYLKVLLQDHECAVQTNPEIRERVRGEIRDKGIGAMHAVLRRVDPDSAAKIRPTDPLRIERALSVFYQTGKPLSQFHDEDAPRKQTEFAASFFILQWGRPVLYDNIGRRVDRMFEAGLVEETRSLLARGFDPKLKPFHGIGYAQALRYINGTCSLERAQYEMKQETRRYAKRQITWFKKVADAVALPVEPGHTCKNVKNRILSLLPTAVGALLLALACVFSAAPVWADAQLFKEAAASYQAEQLNEAQSKFYQLRQQFPYSPEGKRSLYFLGKIARGLKQYEKAEEFYKNAFTENPLLEDYLFLGLAEIYAETDRAEEALSRLADLIARHADSRLAAQAELLRADVLRNTSKSAVAVAHLEKMIALIRSKASEANHFKSALPDLLWKLAQNLAATGKRKPAYETYRELYIRYPAHRATASAIPEMEALAKAIAAEPLTVEQLETRIQNLNAAVRYEESLKELEAYFQDPNNPRGRFYFLRASALNGLRRRDQAIHVLEAFLKRHPGHARTQESHFLIGQYFWNLNKDEDSILHFNHVLHGDTKSQWAAKARMHLARLYESRKDYDKAVEQYAVLAEWPENNSTKETAAWRIGWIHYQKTEYDKARDRFRLNVKRFASDPDWVGENLFWLAKSAEKLGDADSARESYARLHRDLPFAYYGMRARERLAALEPPVQAPAAVDTLIQETAPVARKAPPPAGVSLTAKDQYHLDRATEMMALGWLDDAAYEIHLVEEKLQKSPDTMVWLADWYGRARAYGRSMRVLQAYRNQVEKGWGNHIPQKFWERLYPPAYAETIDVLAQTENIDPHFVRSIIQQESLFDPEALSPAGARGLMQIMPDTGRRLAVGLPSYSTDRLFEPELNLNIGIRYLQELATQFSRDPVHILICYNAGPEPLQKWLERFKDVDDPDVFIELIPYPETRNYVKRVMRNFGIYKLLYPAKEKPSKPDEEL